MTDEHPKWRAYAEYSTTRWSLAKFGAWFLFDAERHTRIDIAFGPVLLSGGFVWNTDSEKRAPRGYHTQRIHVGRKQHSRQ